MYTISAETALAAKPLRHAERKRLSLSAMMVGVCVAFAVPAPLDAAESVDADTVRPTLMPDGTEAVAASADTSVAVSSSAADRLRNDPVQRAPVQAAGPLPPIRLSKDERAIARYIARSYRVANESIERFVHYAFKAAREFRLDPHLVLAVMAVESSFDPDAQSSAGAQGLMQVLTRVHTNRFEPFGGPQAAWDPLTNIKVGASILSEYVKRYGDVAGGLKAYVGAALMESDGGYGDKVMSRQAEFDSVVRPKPAVTLQAKAGNDAVPARTVGVAGDAANPGSSAGL